MAIKGAARNRRLHQPGAAPPAGGGPGFLRGGRRRFPLLFLLGLILLLALFVRLLEVRTISGHLFFESPVIDAAEYDEWAREAASGLAAGDLRRAFLWPEVPIHGPVYPILLGFIYLATGGAMFAARALQALILGAGMAWILYLLANRMFPRRAPGVGLLAAILSALYIPFIRFDVETLADQPAGLFLALGVLLLTPRPGGEGRPRTLTSPTALAAGGFFLGLSMATRPNALFALPLLACWVFWRAGGLAALRRLEFAGAARALGLALLLPAGAALVVGPVAAWNAHLGSGSALMIQGNGGLNLYLGNNPDSPGTPYVRQGVEWQRLLHAPRLEAGLVRPVDEDRFYIRKVLRYLREKPLGVAWLQLRKLYFLLQGPEIRGSITTAFYPGDVLSRLPLPRFGWIAPLAFAGLLLAARRRALASPAAIAAGAIAASIVATVVAERYRLPLVPLLIPHAAWAAIELARRALGREGEEARRFFLRAWLPGLVLLFLFCNIPLLDHPGPSPAEDHYLSSYVLYKRGEWARARAEAERAVALEPDYALAHYQLALACERGAGGARYGAGFDAACAERHYRRAVEIAPDYAEALENLGALAFRQGRPEEGRECYRRAAEARPFAARSWHALGILAEQGVGGERFGAGWDPEEAARMFERAAGLEPRWPAPLVDLAAVRGRTGRHREAAELFRRALLLDPALAEARLGLALSLEQAGERQAAADALEDYLRDFPGDPAGRYHAGRMAEAAGKVEEAMRRYREALALRPDYAPAARRLEALEGTRSPGRRDGGAGS